MSDITFEQLQDREIWVLEYYNILQNEDDDILLVVPRDLPGMPDEPVFYYDGGQHGILADGRMPVIVCDHIHKEVRKVMENCEEILVYASQNAAEDLPEDAPATEVEPAEFMAKVYWQPEIQKLAKQLMKQAKADD